MKSAWKRMDSNQGGGKCRQVACGEDSLLWVQVYNEYGNRSRWFLSVRFFEKKPKTWVRGFRANKLLFTEHKTEQEAIAAGEDWINANRDEYSIR